MLAYWIVLHSTLAGVKAEKASQIDITMPVVPFLHALPFPHAARATMACSTYNDIVGLLDFVHALDLVEPCSEYLPLLAFLDLLANRVNSFEIA